jgi:hypothetical protein
VKSLLVALALVTVVGAAGARAAVAEPRAAHVRVTLSGSTRTPPARVPWRYTVRVVDGAGQPVPAVAQLRVLLAGQPIDTIGLVRFSGTFRGTYRWPRTLAGAWLVLEAKTVAMGVQRTVRFAVQVVGETGRPRFRPLLQGGSRTAAAGAPWHFVVRARDGNGRPVGGTAVVRVAVAGRIVDTIGWFGFRGQLRRTYRWSPSLRGSVALLQATVIGPGGTRTVGYAVRVR